MTPVRLEPAALQSRVKHSTTEPLHSHKKISCMKMVNMIQYVNNFVYNMKTESTSAQMLVTEIPRVFRFKFYGPGIAVVPLSKIFILDA